MTEISALISRRDAIDLKRPSPLMEMALPRGTCPKVTGQPGQDLQLPVEGQQQGQLILWTRLTSIDLEKWHGRKWVDFPDIQSNTV